jgi:hypothetical protein
MRLMLLASLTALTLALLDGTGSFQAAAARQDKKDDPKFTIGEVMEGAHAGKTPLYKKLIDGKATDAEAKDLLAMYQALKANKPPAGPAESWEMKCDNLIKGAKLYVDGKKDAAKTELQKATNCKGCHSVHKG